MRHLGFLVYWLHRSIITVSPASLISEHLFNIAANLNIGTQVALGVLVTANLYNDFHAIVDRSRRGFPDSVTVLAKFNLLQAWCWENFPNRKQHP